jgi:hypothetical protein
LIFNSSTGIKKANVVFTTFFQLAMYSIPFFIYFSDGFELFPSTESGAAIEIKRVLQLLMSVPIFIAAIFGLYVNPSAILKPFVFFIIIKLIVDSTTGLQLAFILEDLLILVTLIVLHSFSSVFIENVIRIWIKIAVIFASLALVKIFIGLLIPNLVNSPALDFLGRSTEIVELGPFSFGRSSSFATEPSLNVLFFLMPAIASILIYKTIKTNSFAILFIFCLLSFSGSFILSLGVALVVFFCLLLIPLLDFRIFFPYMFFVILFFYLGVLNSIESTNFSENFDFSQTNEAFNKSTSFEVRALFGSLNVKALLNHPFGLSFASVEAVNIPGPLLVSVGLAGGWISIIIFIYFLIKLSNHMFLFRKINQSNINSTICIALLVGAMFNFMIFNDYLLINYNGLVILSFTYYLFSNKSNLFLISKTNVK